MTTVMVVCTVACACACAVLVGAEARQRRVERVVAKLLASLSFMVCGLVAASRDASSWTSSSEAIVAGLAAGVVGDAALLGRGRAAFAAGLAAFLVGHVLYLVSAMLCAPTSWLSIWDVVPAVIGAAALVRLWPRLGALRLPVIAYVVTIVAMVVAAISIAATAPRFTLGAALFFASDLAVARDRFIARSFANKAWGLPAYYAGQLVIAWSMTT